MVYYTTHRSHGPRSLYVSWSGAAAGSSTLLYPSRREGCEMVLMRRLREMYVTSLSSVIKLVLQDMTYHCSKTSRNTTARTISGSTTTPTTQTGNVFLALGRSASARAALTAESATSSDTSPKSTSEPHSDISSLATLPRVPDPHWTGPWYVLRLSCFNVIQRIYMTRRLL